MKSLTTLIMSLILAGTGIALPAAAMTPQEKGLAIAVEDDKRDNGFLNYTADAVIEQYTQVSTRDIQDLTNLLGC